MELPRYLSMPASADKNLPKLKQRLAAILTSHSFATNPANVEL